MLNQHLSFPPFSSRTVRNLLKTALSLLLAVTIIGTAVVPHVLAEGTDIAAGSGTASGTETTDTAEGFSASESTAAAQVSAASETAAAADTPTKILNPDGAGAPAVDGKAYALYDVQSGTFLLGSDVDTPLAPASITKVMTILLAFENLKMTDTITVTRDMYESIPDDYVRLGLVEGEEITVEDAIYCCLLISANDAAMALAITMGGSVEGFADMMNKKAVELGCTHTHFTNPYGFADPEHVTTAHDMALIMAAAIQNDMYSKISTTANYTLPASNKYEKTRGLQNGNKFVSTTTYAYEYYIGGKTGFTDLSGHTIVAAAKKDGTTLIGVVLGASSSNIRYEELIKLFNYGFDTYSTDQVTAEEFQSVKDSTMTQITSGITNAGYSLEVTDVKMTLDSYCTTESARSDGGYTCTVDLSSAVILADESVQVLDLPLFHEYSDGSKDQVGVLTVTICDAESAETAAQAAAESVKPKESIGSILIKVGIVVTLLVIIGLCLTVYVMMQREKNRRKNRQKPRVL